MLVLGLDTGGTYTDAVLLDPAARRVVAKNKVFTDKVNLTGCIGECLRSLPRELLETVSLFCISTTLATNAVVEGDSGPVGLLFMGRKADGKFPASIVRHTPGLMDIKGREIQAIDREDVVAAAREFNDRVEAVAVSGFASVRNPAHELAAGTLIREETGLPVVFGHELISSLGHYDRTVTAVINAGLIPKVGGLITAVRDTARDLHIRAPIMIVKGDGSLIRDDAAVGRPIETILSGPAASITGGLYLSGVGDALLLDMGGTTTDLALSRDDKVVVSGQGAWVGGWRTMVRAAAIATFGLGGDSHIKPADVPGRLTIGPRRVQPFCVAADAEAGIATCLERYATLPVEEISIPAHAVFYRLVREPGVAASKVEHMVADALRGGPLSCAGLASRLMVGTAEIPAEEMRRQGIVSAVSLTPTDILHASGELSRWNTDAARAGAALYAAKMGMELEEFMDQARGHVTTRLTSACVDASLRLSGERPLQEAGLEALIADLVDRSDDVLETTFRLKKPVVAVGAPVAAWLPEVAGRLKTNLIIPNHADVANAIGAAVGEIRVTFEALVRPDKEREVYSAHTPDERREFTDRIAAESWGLERIRNLARRRIEKWGGSDALLSERVKPFHVVGIDGDLLYVETRLTVEAIGNPSVITDEREE